MKADAESWKLSTLCVHAGTYLDAQTGGVCSPIFTSTAYRHPSPTGENTYPRYFNVQNQRVVAAKLAALEQGEGALVFGSGMAAIATVLFACLRPGDHVVFQADLYGGTHSFVTKELDRWQIAVSWARTIDEFAAALRPQTKMLFIESPSNPLLSVMDLAAVAELGRRHQVLTVIDNTFATPVNQNPLTWGIDLVVHSGTKYLNGHSDVNCGAVVAAKPILQRVREVAINHGGTLDAHACYLLERGLKTLALRVRQQNANAEALARFLQTHPAIAQVNYPGLPSHPAHQLASKQMRGFGGMLSFELKRPEHADQFLGGLRLATPALSLGGVETLVCLPSRTSHIKMSREERLRAGIRDGLVRVSVGIEDSENLLEDFARALEGA